MREITYRKRRSKKGMIISALVGILVLAALVIFGLFRVKEVVISGNSIYKAADLQKAVMQDGLCKNTLYLLWKYKDDARVEEELPFLSSLEVKMITPYKVQIRVYEKPEIGYILSGTDYIYFDRDGLIVEISKEFHKNIPQVTGLTMDKAVLYEKLPIKDEDLFRTTVSLARSLDKNELVPQEIKFDKKKEMTLYFTSVKVLLGADKELEEKVAALKSIHEKLESMEGTLHMETFTADTRTFTLKQGEKEEEIQTGGAEIAGTVIDKEEAGNPSQEEATVGSAPTYQESDGTFSTDAAGNKIYTDKKGNVTPNVDQYNYVDENGNIITDGYGYIDPYTGGYIN